MSSGQAISDAHSQIVGVLLAGGQSSRLGGGDKCLVTLGGAPMLAHVVDRLRAQVDRLVLSANGDISRFAGFALPITSDTPGPSVGPLGGVLAGMRWTAQNVPRARWIVTVPTDTPFFPFDLVERLAARVRDKQTIAVARSGGRQHPVVAVWPVRLADDLSAWIAAEDHHGVRAWLARNRSVAVDFDQPHGPVDPFFNVNTPENLAEARQMVTKLHASERRAFAAP